MFNLVYGYNYDLGKNVSLNAFKLNKKNIDNTINEQFMLSSLE